eukprot:1027244-Amphidinium_carterae.1
MSRDPQKQLYRGREAPKTKMQKQRNTCGNTITSVGSWVAKYFVQRNLDQRNQRTHVKESNACTRRDHWQFCLRQWFGCHVALVAKPCTHQGRESADAVNLDWPDGVSLPSSAASKSGPLIKSEAVLLKA